MTLVRRTSPFGELMSLRSAMDRLFEDSFVRPPLWTGMFDGTSVPVDVTTTADELVVQASLPGWKSEDVDIAVEGRTLTISGQTRQETEGDRGTGQGQDQGYLVREIRRESFSRTMTLPEGLEPDRATATFDNGILILRIPKAEQAKPRQIHITAMTDGGPLPSSASSQKTPEQPASERSPAGSGA